MQQPYAEWKVGSPEAYNVVNKCASSTSSSLMIGEGKEDQRTERGCATVRSERSISDSPGTGWCEGRLVRAVDEKRTSV